MYVLKNDTILKRTAKRKMLYIQNFGRKQIARKMASRFLLIFEMIVLFSVGILILA